MNKKDLIDELASKSGLTKVAAGDVLDTLTGIVTEQLKGLGEITLPGIGKFTVHDRPERQGRNPKTGDTVTLAASASVKFKQSSTLKASVN